MKLFKKISLLLLLPAFSIAQQNSYLEEWNKEQIDSLQLIWKNTTNDTIRMAAARSLGCVKYVPCRWHSGLNFVHIPRVETRGYKMCRTYGSMSWRKIKGYSN